MNIWEARTPEELLQALAQVRPAVAELTLRDVFAAAALAGLVGNVNRRETTYQEDAADAYVVADAMLRERAKCPSP